ncbi:uncharacterized protein BT62DRAFT_893820, partial [Guyanagaster necrorhizus]
TRSFPILETERASIEKTARETHQYGPTDRHAFDAPNPQPDTPILVFLYGGGFNTGARTLPAPASIIYHNLGSFTTRGFITVVPDYRLADSRVQFPGERDAMQWVMDNLSFPDSDTISSAIRRGR